jgi:hypothetical protein
LSSLGSLTTTTPASVTHRDIADVFRKWDISEWTIHQRAIRRAVRGDAEVEFETNGRRTVLTCSEFPTYQQNIRAVFFVLDALRLADQRGILPQLRDAAIALLPPGPAAARPAYEVLGISPNTPLEIAEAAYKVLARKVHPDAGGTDSAMRELNEAIEHFRKQANDAA